MTDYKVLSAGKFASLREGSADVVRLYVEVERVKTALKDAKNRAAEAVVQVLADNPGAYLTCGDIASATGLTTAAVSQMLGNYPNIRVERVPVRKRLVEMDDKDNVLMWTVHEEVYERTGYCYCGEVEAKRGEREWL